MIKQLLFIQLIQLNKIKKTNQINQPYQLNQIIQLYQKVLPLMININTIKNNLISTKVSEGEITCL